MHKLLLFFTVLITLFTTYGQTDYYNNPVGDSISIADPFALQYNGTYYLYGTSTPNKGFKYWTSENLINW